jgi:hypothetical protein
MKVVFSLKNDEKNKFELVLIFLIWLIFIFMSDFEVIWFISIFMVFFTSFWVKISSKMGF